MAKKRKSEFGLIKEWSSNFTPNIKEIQMNQLTSILTIDFLMFQGE